GLLRRFGEVVVSAFWMTGYVADWKRLLPRKLMPLSMLLLITESAVMTPITEKTPMETPVIVRIDRSLFVRRAPSAMRITSLKFIGHSPLIRPSGTFSPRAG